MALRYYRPVKQSKYRNKKITDSKGNKFDSKKEYERTKRNKEKEFGKT